MMKKPQKSNNLIPVIPFENSIMSYGKGSYLYDTEGKKYLDLNAGQFCTIFGHGHTEITEKIFLSSVKLSHTATNIISEDLIVCAQNIHKISGKIKASCILLSTGAEVVEFCLRFAKHIQGKNGIICFDKGYHGLTLGAQSVTLSGIYAKPLVCETYAIPIPTENDIAKSLTCLENTLKNNSIAALLLEPIVSVGGMLFPPAEWFKEARILCDKYDALLLLDECQTGFGRTGDWFAYQTYNFIPDMVATAKGIGLGFPVSVAMFAEKIIPKNGAYKITHYSSHQNDPFAANIINVAMQYIESHNLLSAIQKKGAYFLLQLGKLERKNCHIANARGCGLMLGVDLVFDGVSDYRDLYKIIYRKMMDRGVIIQGTNGGRTLRFLPDYLIDKESIDFAIMTLNDVLNAL